MKEVPVLSDECKSAFEKLSSMNIKNCQDFDALAKAIDYTDESFVNFLKDTSYSEKSLKNYQQYLSKVSSANEKFATSLKTLAANMTIMLIINIAIKGLIKLWDTLNETAEEQEQKISELNSSIATLQSEYDELSQKQDITDAEKRHLEYLERRLELDERILKAEQSQLFDEKTGKKFTDLFDKDNLNTQYLNEMNPRNKEGFKIHSLFYDSKIDGIDKIHKQIAESKELQAKVAEGSLAWNSYQDSIDRAQEKETKYIDQLSKSENQLTINLGKYADNIEFLQNQLDTGELTEDQTATAKEQLNVWQNLYDETDAMITQIQKLNGTYDDTGERIAKNYSTELNRAKTYLGGYDYSNTGAASTNSTGQQISDFWDENVLFGTEEEIAQNVELWNKVTDGIDDATEAMKAYTNAKENSAVFSMNASSLSFDQAWADSFTSESDAVRELSGSLLELAEKGRLTVKAFNETDSTGYFKSLGVSADEAVSKINKLADESKQLSSMSDQISRMSAALGAKKENGFIDADTLSNFDVEVHGLESWDHFQEVLGSTTSSYEECQEAANALATEWVNSNDFLTQLTEQNKEYYETQLENMGIENYEEVIENALALKEAKEALIDINLADASYEDIEALIAEGEYSPLVTEQMWALYYAKLAEGNTFLDSSSDCVQLQALANDAMLTAEAVKLLNQLMQIYNGLENGAYNGNRQLRTEAVEEAERIKKELENLAKGEGKGLIAKPQLELNTGGGKKSGPSSKSKAKEEKDTAKEYNKDSYQHCIKTYRKYEKILEDNGLENGEVEISMDLINESYRQKLKDGF